MRLKILISFVLVLSFSPKLWAVCGAAPPCFVTLYSVGGLSLSWPAYKLTKSLTQSGLSTPGREDRKRKGLGLSDFQFRFEANQRGMRKDLLRASGNEYNWVVWDLLKVPEAKQPLFRCLFLRTRPELKSKLDQPTLDSRAVSGQVYPWLSNLREEIDQLGGTNRCWLTHQFSTSPKLFRRQLTEDFAGEHFEWTVLTYLRVERPLKAAPPASDSDIKPEPASASEMNTDTGPLSVNKIIIMHQQNSKPDRVIAEIQARGLVQKVGKNELMCLYTAGVPGQVVRVAQTAQIRIAENHRAPKVGVEDEKLSAKTNTCYGKSCQSDAKRGQFFEANHPSVVCQFKAQKAQLIAAFEMLSPDEEKTRSRGIYELDRTLKTIKANIETKSDGGQECATRTVE
jgi:hypothetical protein